MSFNPSSFLSGSSLSPVQSITSKITSTLTRDLSSALASAGSSLGGITSIATQELDKILSNGEKGFFTASQQRVSADALSTLRNSSSTSTFNNTSNPITVVEQKTTDTVGQAPLTFPQDLSSQYYMEFSFAKYKRPAPFVQATFDTVLSIRLPLPSSLMEGYQVNYSSVNLGTTGILADQLTSASASAGSLTDVVNNIQTLYQNQGVNAGADVAGSAYAAVITTGSALDEGAFGAIGQFTGVIPNPHPSVFLEGVDLRRHSFSWLFVPRNAAESAILQQIIQQLRIKTLPALDSTSSTALLDYPYMIQPVAHTGQSDASGSLYQFKRCMGNFKINYTPLGAPAFYGADKAPFAIQLDLDLQEIEYFTATDFDKSAGGNGGDSISKFVQVLTNPGTGK